MRVNQDKNLFSIKLKDVQPIAREILGRDLLADEIEALSQYMEEFLDKRIVVEMFLLTGSLLGF
ncbi:MAG: hypothetical protein JRI56_00060 [Deltaproteobacteria bacterium]|nr:hypothetical protein [Deltaproteobacteria bacterium]